jgi:hypothetical protein
MYNVYIKYKHISKSRLNQLVLILSFLILYSPEIEAQTGVIENQEFNKDSRSLAFALNSNGIAASYRFSKRIDGFRSRVIDIDLAWIKSPKEKKINGFESKFVYGKLNQLVVARLGYGRQKEVYGKYADGGIAISYYYNFGLSVAWLKPVYYEVRKIDKENKTYVEEELFYDYITNVNGRSPFYKGIDESSFAFGGFAKLAVSFDINNKANAINALELGLILDVYHKELPIMAIEKHDQYLLTFFIAYRFGRKKEQRINNQ